MSPVSRLRHTLLILRSLAWNTFRVAVRNKVFLALFVVAVALMAFGLVLGSMSLHHEVRVSTNLSLFVTTVFGAAMAIYVSVSLFYAELEQRTIYTILSKPVPRWQFLLGKYLGNLVTLGVITLLLGASSTALVAFQGGTIDSAFMFAFGLIGCQLAIVSAVATFFVSFSRPLISGLFASGVFVLGHLHSQIGQISTSIDSTLMDQFSAIIQTIIPDLSALNVSSAVVHDLPITTEYLLSAVGYSTLYVSFALGSAMLLFQHRDLD